MPRRQYQLTWHKQGKTVTRARWGLILWNYGGTRNAINAQKPWNANCHKLQRTAGTWRVWVCHCCILLQDRSRKAIHSDVFSTHNAPQKKQKCHVSGCIDCKSDFKLGKCDNRTRTINGLLGNPHGSEKFLPQFFAAVSSQKSFIWQKGHEPIAHSIFNPEKPAQFHVVSRVTVLRTPVDTLLSMICVSNLHFVFFFCEDYSSFPQPKGLEENMHFHMSHLVHFVSICACPALVADDCKVLSP